MSGAGDPTMRIPPVPPAGEPPPGPPPGRPPGGGGQWWWVALAAVLLVVVLVIAVVALASGDDDSDDTSTTTSSVITVPESTTSSAAPATTTTAAATTTTAAATTTTIPEPAVSVDAPDPVACNAPTEVELAWAADNATSVEISIDGVAFATRGPDGVDLFPFPCDGNPHTYVFTAIGAGGLTDDEAVVIEQL